ncbi:bcl-2-like protein 13, partial [Lampetra planeri]
GEVFGLGSEEERGVAIAEDSNDIYILSGEQHPDQLSPPSSLLCTGDNSSGQSSWQTESLPVSLAGHESWAQVSAMDPEDVKSLDSNEGVALAEERSENNSSNSDIVHVEREEAELLEEGGEAAAIEESMMSVLGTESELAELREEFREQNKIRLQCRSQQLRPQPRRLRTPPSQHRRSRRLPQNQNRSPSQRPLCQKQRLRQSLRPQWARPPRSPRHTRAPEPELPVLLYGGAALVVLAAVMAYGVISYRKK